MRDAFVRLGIAEDGECTLMTSPQVTGSVGAPTRDAILDWLLPVYESSDPLESLFVYLSGHGLAIRLGREADTLRTVFVPAAVSGLANSGGKLIDLDELVGRFRRRGAREQVWIIDACRNLPEHLLLNVATIGWDLPGEGDPRDGELHAQSVIYAVAPLAKAQAEKGGHGQMTRHLLDGLLCRNGAAWGAASAYDEAKDTWLIDVESLVDYARRRIGANLSPGDWQREYKLPRVWLGEKKPGPLRDAGTIPHRPFGISVLPDAAAGAVEVCLSVRRNVVASWPPIPNRETKLLPPERYRLSARLVDESGDWLLPQLREPIVDLREGECYELQMVGTGAVSEPPKAPDVAQAIVADVGATLLPPIVAGKAQEAIITVRATDPGARVRLIPLARGKEEQEVAPDTAVAVSPGLWRIEVLLGDTLVSVREDDFAEGRSYEVSATAQITPAMAALMPDPEAAVRQAAENPPANLSLSESAGPMQGAILPTLLPALALKPLDVNNAVLSSFSPNLGIPLHLAATDSPGAVALAFDGDWDEAERSRLATALEVNAGGPAERVWQDSSNRVFLFLQPFQRAEAGIQVDLPGVGTLDAAGPRLSGFCTTLAATLWPDGRADLSLSLFKLPPGSDQMVRPGRLSRALAIAARVFRAGASLDDVNYDVFEKISYGSWGSPELGALAWFGRWRRFGAGETLDPAAAADLITRQNGVRSFLINNAPTLPDTRVIDALGGPREQMDGALDALLNDPELEQPVLADAVAVLARHALSRGRAGHWSVSRFQKLEDAVFNIIRTPN
jgi:hypothetical protein